MKTAALPSDVRESCGFPGKNLYVRTFTGREGPAFAPRKEQVRSGRQPPEWERFPARKAGRQSRGLRSNDNGLGWASLWRYLP